MTEVQITRWRKIPSLVTARAGDSIAKVPMPPRFQEAIDEAAMRVAATDAEAYMEGWIRDPWLVVAGSPSEAAESAAADLEAQWSPEALSALLDSLGPVSEG